MHATTTTKPYNIDKKLVYDAYKVVKANAGAAGVDKQTIEQMLKAAGSAVQQFSLFVVGEGIEKRQDDFAAVVAAQVAAAKQQ